MPGRQTTWEYSLLRLPSLPRMRSFTLPEAYGQMAQISVTWLSRSLKAELCTILTFSRWWMSDTNGSAVGKRCTTSWGAWDEEASAIRPSQPSPRFWRGRASKALKSFVSYLATRPFRGCGRAFSYRGESDSLSTVDARVA